MTKYIQSGIECHSLPEVYYLGCRIADPGVEIYRYDAAPLSYHDSEGVQREWWPAFRERLGKFEAIIEVEGHATVDDVVVDEMRKFGTSTFREKIRANPDVRLVNGMGYRADYMQLVADNKIPSFNAA